MSSTIPLYFYMIRNVSSELDNLTLPHPATRRSAGTRRPLDVGRHRDFGLGFLGHGTSRRLRAEFRERLGGLGRGRCQGAP